MGLLPTCQPRDLVYQKTGLYIQELCLIITDDPIHDENCGHSGDRIIL